MLRLRSMAAVVAVVVLAVGCGGEGGSPRSDARTYYESLDLGSPRAAADVFVDAFARDDFMAVWLVLDQEAQFQFSQSFNLMEYGRIIRNDAVPDFAERLSQSLSSAEIESGEGWYLFDSLMLVADEYDAFLIDLSTDVKLGDVSEGGGAASLSASIGGIDGDVTIRLTENAQGRWKVRQVVIAGGDEDQIPWSVPSTGS